MRDDSECQPVKVYHKMLDFAGIPNYYKDQIKVQRKIKKCGILLYLGFKKI
jgi:hypothetical protein